MAAILLGCSGSIALYKIADLASGLTGSGHDVTVCMTESATRLVTPQTFRAVTGNPVYTAVFDDRQIHRVDHVRLGETADLFCLAPATANILAKAAHGIADDLVSLSLLTTRAPLVIAPAMNDLMWSHPAVRANVETLKKRGAVFVEPGSGDLACGRKGIGRLAEPAQIETAIERVLAARTSGLRDEEEQE